MKKFFIFLMAFAIFFPTLVNAEQAVLQNPNTSLQDTIDVFEGNKEIRNQNIFVPTKDGVQRATYEEALKIEEYKQRNLTELTKSYLLGDYKSGQILQSYNIDEVRPMASTSKLVSVFVVMDEIKKGTISKTDTVLIDNEAASLTGSSYKLKENDIKTVSELLEASLIVSGNDAITALAKYVGGSKEEFVNMMNEKCRELGLKNAHMVNPTGLTDYAIEDYNKMTTREMFILSRELISKYPEILEITSKPKIEDTERNFIEYNTNPTLGITEGIDGLKTGYTNASGRCLIATGVKKADGEKTLDTRLIGIVTGCPNDWMRYVAANRLMGEGLEKYKYILVGNEDEPEDVISIEGAADEKTNVYVKNQGSALWDGESEFERKFFYKPELKAPIAVGENIGYVKYYMKGEEVLKLDLIVKDRVSQKGILSRIKNAYEDIFIKIDKAA